MLFFSFVYRKDWTCRILNHQSIYMKDQIHQIWTFVVWIQYLLLCFQECLKKDIFYLKFYHQSMTIHLIYMLCHLHKLFFHRIISHFLCYLSCSQDLQIKAIQTCLWHLQNTFQLLTRFWSQPSFIFNFIPINSLWCLFQSWFQMI